MDNLSPQILRELLSYNPDTGELFWKPRDRKWFSDDRFAKSWNTRFANNKALTAICSSGYFHGDIFNNKYRAHRVAWAIYYGEWPKKQIDHINGNRLNNTIENLRDVSGFKNQRNRKKPKNNTSGVIGVVWMKPTKKWRAQIRVDGKFKHIGYFDNKPDAIAARKAAEVHYGFHANHGMR